MKKNFLWLTILAALTLVLGACGFGGDSSKDDSSKDGKTLKLAIASEPPTLNPQLSTDTQSGSILNGLFEGLTRVDAKGKVENAMAKDIKVSKDQLTYTFTLRDAKWSNGDKVVAGDFEYAWKWALNPKNASQYASILYPIKGAEAYNLSKGKVEGVGIKTTNDETLVVTLTNPTPYFTQLTAFYTFMPVNQKVAEANKKWAADATDQYVTNGPFTLKEWKHNDSVVLAKSDSYWDKANVDVDTIDISMVESNATANRMFQKGDLDFLGAPFQSVPLDAVNAYKESKQLNIKDTAAIYLYKFNTKDDVMKNANIRKALTLAIDRESLIKNVLKAEQKPAKGLVPSAINGWEGQETFYKDNDVEGAKKALEAGMKELGIKDAKDLTIKVSINTDESHAAIAQFIQEGWKKNLGINVAIDNAEWQVFLTKMTTFDYQVGRMGWTGDYNDANTFLDMYSSAENGNNHTGWSNPKYTEFMAKANKEADADKRIKLLQSAEAVAMSEFPAAPIYDYTTLFVSKDHVKNMAPDLLSNINLKAVKIDK
ncbi:oligopeptide-binding protein OppA [Kurthia zopfii]|uniref:Oligopeptide transport system substrate-binding protein n=1 Tax=Kurthia zopfii TaxID=1650 RepID=A0A8B4QD33_9BACL|nr:peptide ABC transporter substrate-binding protein [Kurthia zopfii]PWI23831.1 ABC transporter substrate-binding protein [Kurthia zopfii]TDR43406.1 oligopeptide transport system substrate-binding protein [Kurthia zopfii]GEK31572.1 oligopeptide-binding protein OppA [Kurthia zopfii]STX10660.1 Stage 0 sporulation protein KA [Kurthia zopfii]